MKTSIYQKQIQVILNDMGGGEFTIDPRHIEAWMRLEHSTLDGLSFNQFEKEVKLSVECFKSLPLIESEKLAISFNL